MPPLAHALDSPPCYRDYLEWDDRWELINGVVYDMTPAPSRMHQKISGDLFSLIHNQLDGKPCEVYAAPFDVRLPDKTGATDNETNTVVQPDIVVICDPEKLDDRGCLGAPDLVVEILSPATAAKDLQVKRDLYEKHGVKEYWIVHPADKLLMAYRPGATGEYTKAAVYAGLEMVESTAVPGIVVHLVDIFGMPQEEPSKTSPCIPPCP